MTRQLPRVTELEDLEVTGVIQTLRGGATARILKQRPRYGRQQLYQGDRSLRPG